MTMRILLTIIIFGVASTSVKTPVYGQVLDYGGAASGINTPASSYAHSLSEIVRARSQENALNSQAAINYSMAQRQQIENQNLWVKSYFEVRELNRRFRQSMEGPRARPEDYVRYAQMGRPDPLSPSQLDSVSGEIRWPAVLQTPPFEPHRNALQELFRQRAERGVWSSAAYLAVFDTVDAAQTQLQSVVASVPPEDYMRARRFLESLAFEARNITQ